MKHSVDFTTAMQDLEKGYLVTRKDIKGHIAYEPTTLLNPKHYPAGYALAGVSSPIKVPAHFVQIHNGELVNHDYQFTDSDRAATDWTVLCEAEPAANAETAEAVA